MSNSTLSSESGETDAVKHVLVVTAIPVVLVLSIAIILVLVVWACWRRRRGNKEYRRVPTTDTSYLSQNELRAKPKRRVEVVLPDPPPPKTHITLATDLTKCNSTLLRYLPHDSATNIGSSNCGEKNPPGVVGVAAHQAFLCLNMSMNDSRLMVEVQDVVGLPSRADGTSIDPLVKLNMVSREKKYVRKSSTHAVPIDPELIQTIDCGSMAREELEHSILHVEVLDHWSFYNHVIAAADITLDHVKEGPTRVPLNIVRSGYYGTTFSGHNALISLYYDKASSKLLVAILKVKLPLDTALSSSTDYWMKVAITKGDKYLVKEKVKHASVVSDEIHFNKSIICHNVSDIISLSVQCSLITMTTINFMRRPKVVGTVTLGSQEQGQALRHWNDVLMTPNTPIAEWHDLT